MALPRGPTGAITEEQVPDEETCRLFKLPAELRNRIYELTFTSGGAVSEEGTIELSAARPPSKETLLVCKRFHNEAAGIYRDAYRQYWETSSFTITGITGKHAYKVHHLSSVVSEEDLRHIKNLALVDKLQDHGRQSSTYQDGVWTARFSLSSGSGDIGEVRRVVARYQDRKPWYVAARGLWKWEQAFTSRKCWVYISLTVTTEGRPVDDLDADVQRVTALASRRKLTFHEIEGVLRVSGPLV